MDSSKNLLCEELAGLHSWWDLPGYIGGDFNVVRFPSERSGASRLRPAMLSFSDFISDLELVDFPLMGCVLTWSNNQTWSRLHRFSVSPKWESHYLEVCQKRLPRLCSNHFPILLDFGGIQGGRNYLKFKNVWLKTEGFLEQVRQWWSSYQILGTL